MLKKEVAVKLFEHLIDHDWHGYSQVSRWGDGEGQCEVTAWGKAYKLEQGDRDCSSAIISAYEAAGISCGGATYTGNMRACMTKTGNFKWHAMSSGYVAKRGDVYLNELYHTAMCLSETPDTLGKFSISETGGIDGAEGDQTGWESHKCAYYSYPWNGILECVNAEEAVEKAEKNAWKKKGGFWYWLDECGRITTGWKAINNLWYFFEKDGKMATGWRRIDGKYYFFGASGRMLKGWQQINGQFYYLTPAERRDADHPHGSMRTGFLNEGRYTYYLREKADHGIPEGAMVNGWYDIDGDTYFFNTNSKGHPNGSMFRNHWVGKYYLKDDGKMAKNETLKIGGKEYKFNSKGVNE